MSATPKSLTTRLSDESPRSAHILARGFANGSAPPTYDVQVGEVTLKDVSVNEVLQFVSPRDLEMFENASFKREIAEENRRAAEKAAAKRQPGRPRKQQRSTLVNASSDSAAIVQSSADDELPDAPSAPEVGQGRHGRPRPVYSHLYLKQPARQAKSAAAVRRKPGRPPRVTPASDLDVGTASLALDDAPKRRRLDHAGSHSRSISTSQTPTSESEQSLPKMVSPAASRSLVAPSPAGDTEASETSSIVSSSSELDINQDRIMADAASHQARESVPVQPPAGRQTAAPLLASQYVDSTRDATSSTPSLRGEVSPDMEDAPPAEPPGDVQEGDDYEDEEVDAFEIESILDSRMSDPRTHPAELGKKAVRLYLVKWVGYDKPSWEPIESFDDEGVLEEYWHRVGRDKSTSSKSSKGKERAH